MLFIANALFDAVKAVEAYLNGEPARIVFWLSATAAVSALTSVVGMFVLTAGWGFGISVILALAYMAVVAMTTQELTLPQRLWVHRSVFGQHQLNYYNSEPFGGDKPTSASPEERQAYQRRALNEEAQALAMLAEGITLEIHAIVPAIKNIDPLFPEWKGAQNKDAPEYSDPVAIIKISIPENLNGIMKISIIEISKAPSKLEGKDYSEEYIIDNKEIYIKDHKDEQYRIDSSFDISAGMLKKMIDYTFKKGTTNELTFGFYRQENKYEPIASDRITIEG